MHTTSETKINLYSLSTHTLFLDKLQLDTYRTPLNYTLPSNRVTF